MASTKEFICNLALSRVKADEIGEFDEQSKEAEKCRVFYDQALEAVQTDFNWNFCKATRVMSLKDISLQEWEYCYDYPTNCLNIRYVLMPNQRDIVYSPYYNTPHNDSNIPPVNYEVLTGGDSDLLVIGCDVEDATLVYSKKVTDLRLFDALFTDMLAWRLAQDLSIPLGGDSGKKYRNDAFAAYEALENKAKTKTANERFPRRRQQSPRSIQARTGGIPDANYRRGR